MTNWKFNPNEYTARDFTLIPEGDHKVIINNIEEKVFSTGNEGFEITFDVEGFNSKLWYYLVLDPNNTAKTNQRLGMFLDSFAIQDYNLSNYNNWIGKNGAVRVKHNTYNGSRTANVAFCLSRSQQGKLLTQQSNPFDTRPTPVTTSSQRVFDGFAF